MCHDKLPGLNNCIVNWNTQFPLMLIFSRIDNWHAVLQNFGFFPNHHSQFWSRTSVESLLNFYCVLSVG